MDKRFVQAHKEARWALAGHLYLARPPGWPAAYLPGVAIGFYRPATLV